MSQSRRPSYSEQLSRRPGEPFMVSPRRLETMIRVAHRGRVECPGHDAEAGVCVIADEIRSKCTVEKDPRRCRTPEQKANGASHG